MANNVLTDITINGYVFKGYSDFACINSKTYVVEPERASDGSIPDINAYAVFYVPRVKISFKYMSVADYQRFLIAIEPNEFVVSYFDYTKGEVVYHKMYCEPQELEKLHTHRLEVLGILNKEISLIGTLNSVDTFVLTYMANGGLGSVPGETYVEGQTLRISDGTELSRLGYSLKKWNTKVDGSGIDYLLGSYKVAEGVNMTLYAIWEQISSYSIFFDYNGATKPSGANDADWIESKTISYGGSVGTLPAPSVTGYRFGGWYVYLDYEPSKYEDNQTYNVKGSITLKAKWIEA